MSKPLMHFDVFYNRFLIEGDLVAVTPIHIGAPETDFVPAAVDKNVIKDGLGRPFIPGSSLKGALRSFAEKLVRAGFLFGVEEGRKTCSVVEEPCLGRGNLMHRSADDIAEQLCVCCRVFGSPHYSGKVYFNDVMVDDSWENRFDLRTGVGIGRDSGTAQDSVLYDFEAVPAGTRFKLRISADNLAEDELKLITVLLVALKNGDIPIGGLTTRGLGGIRLEGGRVYKVDEKNLLQYLLRRSGSDEGFIGLDEFAGEVISLKGGDANV